MKEKLREWNFFRKIESHKGEGSNGLVMVVFFSFFLDIKTSLRKFHFSSNRKNMRYSFIVRIYKKAQRIYQNSKWW